MWFTANAEKYNGNHTKLLVNTIAVYIDFMLNEKLIAFYVNLCWEKRDWQRLPKVAQKYSMGFGVIVQRNSKKNSRSQIICMKCT